MLGVNLNNTMERLVALITGGNSGIGKATAIRFAKHGYEVIITCRDKVKGAAAIDEIRQASGSGHVRMILGDLSTIGGCQALVSDIQAEVRCLNVLINNAGVFMTQKELNSNGFEMNFMVNYLAPFILSSGLAELLSRSNHARILNVNTGMHLYGNLELDKTPFGKDFDGAKSYGNSKLANAMLTIDLAERLKGTTITVNAFNPGLYNTTVVKARGIIPVIFKILGPIFELFQPIAESSVAPFYLATDQRFDGVTGQYFNKTIPANFAKQAMDRGKRQALWQQSMKWISASWSPF